MVTKIVNGKTTVTTRRQRKSLGIDVNWKGILKTTAELTGVVAGAALTTAVNVSAATAEAQRQEEERRIEEHNEKIRAEANRHLIDPDDFKNLRSHMVRLAASENPEVAKGAKKLLERSAKSFFETSYQTEFYAYVINHGIDDSTRIVQ